MRSNIIQEMLDRITPEEHVEFEREMLEAEAYHRWLEENGYSYNTDKSYSLKLLNDAGHFPIGITTMMCEETFIFNTEKEATKAWKSGVLGNDGWFYGKRNFQKDLDKYEKDMGYKNEIFWIDEK